MEPSRGYVFVACMLLFLLHVHLWAIFDGHLTRPEIVSFIDSRGPKRFAEAKRANIFGMPVSYIAPPPRKCTTMPVGVLSGYAPKRQAVRNTWGKDVCVYFIVGKKDGAWPEEEATHHGDLLLLDMEEVYHGITSILPYKTAIWFYLAHEQFPQAMHVLKTDDDSYVEMGGLQVELTRAQPDYWGCVHRGASPVRDPKNKYFLPSSMWNESVFPDYCSGAGYVLSRKALECFVSKIGNQTYIAREDVSTGIVMQTCGIRATQSELVDMGGNFVPSKPWLIKHYVKNLSEIIPTAPEKSSGPYRILVTGGAGFIGMHTSLRLRGDGHHVVAYDNLNSYYSPTLKEARVALLLDQDIFFAHADVCNTTALTAILDEHAIDRVIHLAAQAGVRYSLDHPHEYTKNNVDCFVALLEALKGRDVRLVYASSSSVYGLNDKIPFSEHDPVDKPASLYAATKRMNELTAHVYHNLYGQPSVGLRFFTVYGPWGRPDMAYYSFTDKILRGETITMFNHGNLERDFTYIDDVVEGIVASLDLLLMTPEVLNLGNNNPVPLRKFIEILEGSVGKKANITSLDMQPGDVPRTFADISKAQQILGYKPHTPLEEGIPQFVQWFKEHQEFVPTVTSFDAKAWCATHATMPNGAFCTSIYAGLDKGLATALLPILNGTIGDFGAGGGWYSSFFQNHSIESTPYDASPTRPASVHFADLSTPLDASMPAYDWVLCLEVGEHLSTDSENIFIDNVAGHARLGIVMSWAVPGQGGNEHVNERPNDWVIEQLRSRAFTYDKEASDILREEATFSWFKNTLMVFRQD